MFMVYRRAKGKRLADGIGRLRRKPERVKGFADKIRGPPPAGCRSAGQTVDVWPICWVSDGQ